MKKFLITLLAFVSCCQLAFAATGAMPDKFILYPKDPNLVDSKKLMYDLKPGDEITEQIALKNYSSLTKNYALYVTDSTVGKNGVYIYSEPTVDRKMTQFVSIDTPTATIDSNDEKLINVHVKIPTDATPGEYMGGIAAVKTEPSPTMPNIKIAVRYMLDIDLKIDQNPQHIPKLSEQKTPTPYLFGSVGLFGGSMGYYFYAKRKEKKTKKHNGQNPENKV